MPIVPADATLALALLPFAAAAFGPWLTARIGAKAGWVLAVVPGLLFLYFLQFVSPVAAGQVFRVGVDWVPSIGVRYSVLIDGLSLMFALLITGIGTLIIIYAGGYLKNHPLHGRFFSFMLLFMGAMLGLVLADDLIALFVFWELTSITSFLLIGFDSARREARRAALQALFITGGGGLALLAGLILATTVFDVTSLSDMLAAGETIRNSQWYLPILVLVLIGAFTKSARVPFHSWLANAMEAPTPVSAYLHSATMVKAGVYLLMRLQPAMGGTEAWMTVLPLFGGATLLAGTILAVRQTDLKLILAYTTVASLGLLVMLTGLDADLALVGAVLYLIAHAFFKGGLFMATGAVDHEAGTRDITRLGRLAGKMPMTTIAVLLATVSMAGLLPMLGFVAKEVLYEGILDVGNASIVLAVAVIGNGLMFSIAAVFLIVPFFGRSADTPKTPHEAPLSLWLGPIVLGGLGLATALLLDASVHYLVAPMAQAVAGHPIEIDLHLVPTHVTPPLILTLITIGFGIVCAIVFGPLRRLITGLLDVIGWGPDRGFDQLMKGLVSASAGLMPLIQPGQMTRYLMVAFTVVAAMILIPLAVFDEWPRIAWYGPEAPPYFWAPPVLALVGLCLVILAKRRAVAILSLGVQGTMVALIYMMFGAPDLSFTQFMVEVLSVVILALAMTRLNLRSSDHRPWSLRLRDGALSVACGTGFALVLISVVSRPFDERLSAFFMDNAYAIAHGKNVVNVILVDFRAIDTLGEISVVMTAGLAILALMRLRGRAGVRLPTEPDEKQRVSAGDVVDVAPAEGVR